MLLADYIHGKTYGNLSSVLVTARGRFSISNSTIAALHSIPIMWGQNLCEPSHKFVYLGVVRGHAFYVVRKMV